MSARNSGSLSTLTTWGIMNVGSVVVVLLPQLLGKYWEVQLRLNWLQKLVIELQSRGLTPAKAPVMSGRGCACTRTVVICESWKGFAT